MAITIVTEKGYIHGDKVHSVVIEEHVHRIGAKKKDELLTYQINLQFSDGKDDRHTTIQLFNKAEANKVYRSIIDQIRNQCPDKEFMDQLLEKHVLGDKK